jgi:predicted dehydrogenase
MATIVMREPLRESQEMAGKKLTVAVIGGGIGRAHIEEGYALNADRFEVAALCDPDAARRDAVADEFGISRRVASFEEVLDMRDVDVVDICTPPFLHFDQVRAALDTGKHVICEKPLVGSLQQVDALADLETRSRGRLMPVFQSRFGDGVQQVRRLIDAGLCGKAFLATAETCWRRGAAYYAVPWRGKRETELGGTLLSHAIHTHDVLTYLMGPIASVSGVTTTRVNSIETEDCFSASGTFASGAPVSLAGTLGSRTEFTRLYLAFEQLTVESDIHPYDYSQRPWHIVPASDEVRTAVETTLAGWQTVPPGFASQFRLFAEALASDRAMPVTTADARRALELVTAVYRSSELGKRVALPLAAGQEGYAGLLQ